MATLAIKGHENRGREVIGLLEKNGYKTSKMVEELQPYNEQKEKRTIQVYKAEVISFADAQNKEYELDLADKFEIVLKEGKYFAVKKKTQYPKTYEECLKVLGYMTDMSNCKGYKGELLESFQHLLICRDAYWKVAGDWKPEFRFGKKKHCIMTKDNRVINATVEETNRILTFPTSEMRDAFYENFKGLIESCKELL